MEQTAPAAELTAANTYSDKDIIQKFIGYKKENRLILDGLKPDGKKKQFWEPGEVDLDEHLNQHGTRKYGVNTAYELYGKLVAINSVVDVDGFKDTGKTTQQFCQELFQLDNTAIPFKSPSGVNFHVWKFYLKPIPVAEAHEEARSLGFKLEELGYKIDYGKCNPSKSGSQVGINLPFGKPYQRPIDPRGNMINNFQLVQRIRFQKFPFVSAIINLPSGKNRHDALLYAAGQLAHSGHDNLEYYNSIKLAFNHSSTDSFDEDWFKRVIQDERKYLQYELSHKTIEAKIGEAIGVKDFKFKSEWKKPEPKKEKPAAAAPSFEDPPEYLYEDAPIEEPEEVKELEVTEHTWKEKITPRKWVIAGWLMEKCLTILAGQPGIGKTIILHMLAYCLSTGTGFFGKVIHRPGNVLLIAAEETLNEMNIRLAAIHQFLGGEFGKFKIYKRGLEEDLKLVRFKSTHAEKTPQYKQLEKLIIDKDIKHIILDPLINFQQGNYDENSNQHMEEYVKNGLIPLTFKNNGTLIAGHHTNKLSMIKIDDDSKDIEIDPQSALTAPRGASSLVGAARFVIAMQPMLKKIWNKFKEHVKDGSNFIHYTGLIEAKSNYNLVADDIAWLKKNTVEVAAEDESGSAVTEKTGVFSLSTLSEITKNKLSLKAAENELYVRNNMPLIKKMFDDAAEDKITLNSVVVRLLGQDPRMAETDIKESTIKTDIRRKLINGLGGNEQDIKGQYTRTGIEFEDGYNYWYSIEQDGKQGKWYIERGKNFKK